jgi:hypothetical protein
MSAEGILVQPPATVAADVSERPRLAIVDAARGSAPETLAQLCTQFVAVCESAVDPLEIACALEFDGITDRVAQLRYQAVDVFALAREMYSMTPRAPAEPEPAPDPWRDASKLRPVLHSLLYGLPGVFFPVAAALLVGPGVLATLVLALLLGWGLSQGLASIGFLRLGTGGAVQARRALRAGLPVGLALVAVAMTTMAFAVHARTPVLVFGGSEGAYMLSACALLVLGAEGWLLIALAPGAIGGVAFLLLGRPPNLEHLVWWALATAPVLALIMAGLSTLRPGPRAGPLLAAAELRPVLVAVAFGLVAAGLLTFPVVAGPAGFGGINVGALLASLPLSLSMGAAEWSLLAYRRRTRQLLSTGQEFAAFTREARIALLAALIRYAAAAIALTAATVAVATSIGLVAHPQQYLPELGAYLMLGCALFLALLLQALRLSAVPLAAAAVTLAVEIALRHYGIAVQLAASAILLAVVAAYAAVSAGQVMRHAI